MSNQVKIRRGRPPYEPSNQTRRLVELVTSHGVPQDEIARIVGIDTKTLRKHHRQDLDRGLTRAEAELAADLLRIAPGRTRRR
jgi:DNA-directed RNA polymerase specialized sigma24 family protein